MDFGTMITAGSGVPGWRNYLSTMRFFFRLEALQQAFDPIARRAATNLPGFQRQTQTPIHGFSVAG
jgi:hypothetical protein